ncbi:undecaprenyldiphospho-muramoylpentapeptide beta-N-acetylglucosaminyltransferase [Thiohalocapsa marina]|uniref:UDP-N-acetylglucosamine--N-acetylmuramyl-(pentapeptide) pyrophosphoryl-undecaprenol N-acetylglucosamine transferase n=1 Tax=Thiohalocapsa marina TaxID=424902 RepID=A0A5M8FQ31_9GAMM|nr:undecaprenyldiphospho-muramoylpentapeptide beta-N-acetylglucosaminyltransferase [Thiohalocapsa marina]KAA6186624.1 undecaprenyldiphospho-muramoylpentapeptide beta-N-acetylglucosaminyltransferase [Thiohalocapsa marina]
MVARIAVMAGGTGGHVFPALAVAEALRDRGAQVFWVGTRSGMEAHLVPQHGFDIEWIDIEGIRGKGLRQALAAPWKLTRALLQATALFRRRAPEVVLGMGGFVSGPGGLAARIQGRPLVIQEQNSVPGMTNQWLSRLAAGVFEAFPGSFPPGRRALACGNPVRAGIAALAPPAERFAARSGPPRLLVIGGSLGARALNRMVPCALGRLPAAQRPLVRHQAGVRTLDEAERAYADAGVAAEVTAFIDDMAEAYAWADLCVCRAGALTVSELAAVGLPAIFVPFPYAVDDHQVGNARFLSDAGAAELIIERDLTPEGLAGSLSALLADPARRLAMAEAARARASTDAAAVIADACLRFAGADDVSDAGASGDAMPGHATWSGKAGERRS